MDKTLIVVVAFVTVVVFGGWYLVGSSAGTAKPTQAARSPAFPTPPATNPPSGPRSTGGSSSGSVSGQAPAISYPQGQRPANPTSAPPSGSGAMNTMGALRLNLNYPPQSFSALAMQVQRDTGLHMLRDVSLPEPQNISVSLKDAAIIDLYDAISRQIGVPWQPFGMGGAYFTKTSPKNP